MASFADAQRMVFAHYMVTNQDYQGDSDPTQELKIAAYEREIRQAQAAGIDGFALNVGGWLHEPYYIRYSAQMFEAAARLNSGFKLMFSADMCCGNTAADVEDMVRRFANNPRFAKVYFQHDGKFVLTTFAGEKLGEDFWKAVLTDLSHGIHPSTSNAPNALASVSGTPDNSPMPVYFVPAFFWGGELPTKSSVAAGVDQWKNVIDGAFYWGIAGTPGSNETMDQLPSSEAYADVLRHAGKLYMAPVCLQFWGANASRYFEYNGPEGMRAMWMDAIQRTKPDWVEIITWNDFIEGTYVSPIDEPNRYPGANFLTSSGIPANTEGYFHTHQAATALLPFFIQWYKTGKQPTISRDAVYFFYRTQLSNANAAVPPVARSFGHPRDVIYVTANLTAPAEIRVISGKRTTVLHIAAGSTDVEAPLGSGDPPVIQLLRDGREIGGVSGVDAVTSAPRYNNFYYSSGFFTIRQ